MELILKKSTKPNKKLMLVSENKTVHFGSKPNKDFTIYSKEGKEIANKRKQLYDNRHKAREDWSDMLSNGALAKFVLWNKPNLQSSMRDFGKRFNLKVTIKM